MQVEMFWKDSRETIIFFSKQYLLPRGKNSQNNGRENDIGLKNGFVYIWKIYQEIHLPWWTDYNKIFSGILVVPLKTSVDTWVDKLDILGFSKWWSYFALTKDRHSWLGSNSLPAALSAPSSTAIDIIWWDNSWQYSQRRKTPELWESNELWDKRWKSLACQVLKKLAFWLQFAVHENTPVQEPKNH